MGIFYWPITKRNYQALHSPKINMLQCFSFGLVIYATRVELRAKDLG